MSDLRGAADAIISRALDAAQSASPEDLVYLAKAVEAVGVTSAVNFINATSEMQDSRLVATGNEQDARLIEEGDAQAERVRQTMNGAVASLTERGDMLWCDGQGAQRLPMGAAGSVLRAGQDGAPHWGAGRLLNTGHHYFSDITRTTWGSKGNLLNGAAFTYTPVGVGSWFWVDHRIFLGTNQSYATTEIMVNVAGGGWQATTSMPLKRGAGAWTSFGGNHYYGGSASGYHGDGNSPYKLVGSVLVAPAYEPGQSIQFGATAWCQGGSWFSVNESYSQNNYVSRYGWSEIHVFELLPPPV